MTRRTYVTPDGTKYPLFEATHDYPINVYKTDCRKAKTGDPEHCLIALGAKRDKAVEAAFVGGGKDAYIIFKRLRGRAAHAMHYTINARAGRVRDFFDTHKGVTSQILKLSAPTAGRTLDHRSKLNKKLAIAIKAGKHTPKKRGKSRTRIMRIGAHPRPRAVVEKGIVSIGVGA